jgi:TrmH family RNA methyltransferase
MITSLNNSTVKQIRALRHRKERAVAGQFLVEGIRIVGEAVQTGAKIESLIVSPELLTSSFAYELVAEQRAAGVPCLNVAAKVFASLSGKEGPQGLAAVLRQRWDSLDDIWPQPNDLWIALDSPQDPGNLGAIMRTADAAGARGIILVGHSADPYDPGAIRASMGSVFAMRLVQTDVAAFRLWKGSQGIAVFGASGAATKSYREVTYPRPLVLLSGSEREGLSDQLLQVCDQLVSIPMVGRADSLNLAVATSIMLYAATERLT